jgi:hypothetical protein
MTGHEQFVPCGTNPNSGAVLMTSSMLETLGRVPKERR